MLPPEHSAVLCCLAVSDLSQYMAQKHCIIPSYRVTPPPQRDAAPQCYHIVELGPENKLSKGCSYK